ncbi:MAG: PIN domain-containing protein [Thermoflexus sp.]|uniref:type II toxin-antitoxin system VapC family toxin n=1 Tax=Thermoflexus sp. TaxID=1969742 RepID=UPI0025F0DE86|nr:PIN domain-containing protein [Thermoflexus sp.]MCS6964721.1 PIN domain-containing protein [Thermoflexus sp.]
MMLFVDTSAIYALLDAGDRYHPYAKTVWLEWMEQPVTLVCSNYVFLESVALIQRQLGVEAALRFITEMAPAFRILWIRPSIHRAAVSAFLAARRPDISLVDYTSFELMRRLGIRIAFTFDCHFAEQGFEVVP